MYNDIVEIYDQIFPLNQAFLKFLRDYLPEGGGRVLDLGCGPGDMVGLLAEEGYQAVGIDSSEGMITAAKAHQRGTFYPFGFDESTAWTGISTRFGALATASPTCRTTGSIPSWPMSQHCCRQMDPS